LERKWEVFLEKKRMRVLKGVYEKLEVGRNNLGEETKF
jgi:hypothetical protein